MHFFGMFWVKYSQKNVSLSPYYVWTTFVKHLWLKMSFSLPVKIPTSTKSGVGVWEERFLGWVCGGWWHSTFCLRSISGHSWWVGWSRPKKGQPRSFQLWPWTRAWQLYSHYQDLNNILEVQMLNVKDLFILHYWKLAMQWQRRLRMSLPIKGWCCPHILASRNKPRDYHHLGLTFIHLGWRNNLEPFRNYALKIFQFSAHIIPRKYNLNFIKRHDMGDRNFSK